MIQPKNVNTHTEAQEQSEGIGKSNVSEFGCPATSYGDQSGIDADATPLPMSVTIDGQPIELTPFDNNIVDVASRAKIAIPAPCYRAKRSKGCCSACVVEIDGQQKFACATIPENGMIIAVDRADLKTLRKQRLLEYKEGIKSGNPCGCSLADPMEGVTVADGKNSG